MNNPNSPGKLTMSPPVTQIEVTIGERELILRLLRAEIKHLERETETHMTHQQRAALAVEITQARSAWYKIGGR